ncbi:MAG TPA: VWA domain-containing protein [Verrucomicrobiae bacterium]|nr:VWA domain-containing protein [Verrucomicrobiae bacterium]
MNFANPKMLWVAVALLPLLALFFWLTWRKRRELVRQFVRHKTLSELTLGISAARQKFRRVFLFTATALLLLAIAGPQWGFIWEEATQRGRDVIIAVDTSRSMLAADLQPDRLTRAKLAALDLLKLGKFDRFGLIAFAGSAFLQCPLTFDDEAFRQSVQILEPGIIPQGGTAISQAIQTARDAYGTDAEENHKILILFTDGEDHEEGAVEAAEKAAGDGIKIFTVGVGTPSGELLRLRDEHGNLTYVKDESGNVVKSRLNEQLLQQIATAAKGFYIPLQGANAMDVLYQRGLEPLPTSERSTKLMKRLKEQYYWPLGAAVLLLLLEVFFPEQKRTARRQNASEPATPSEGPIVPAAATAAALLILSGFSAHASAAKAQRHYKAGEYKSALIEYQELIGKNPNDARLHYNAGTAAYQAKKFDEAQKEFQAAAASPELDLQQQSFYNLGDAEFRIGEASSNLQERMASWEQAIQHYDAALKINPKDSDAEFNRDVVRKKLEELKKQQQEQKKDQQDKNQQQNNKDENKDKQKDQQQKNKQDQQNKDNKSDEQKNSEEQKKNQQKQDQKQRREEEKQKQQQAQSEKEKQEKKNEQSQANKGGQKDSDQQKQDAEAATAAQFAQLGKMTPQQAKQLLDAQRSEEKALLFIPQNRKAENQNRIFKDW